VPQGITLKKYLRPVLLLLVFVALVVFFCSLRKLPTTPEERMFPFWLTTF